MFFNSLLFILFLAVTLGLYWRLPWPGWVLLVASLVNYAFSGWQDTLLLVAVLAANWGIARLAPTPRIRIAAAVLLNIGLLFWIKYRRMFLGDTGSTGSYVDTTLPLGISFYCFQILAYHLDVGRNKTEEAPGFPHFFLFITFFPQLVAGPIIRSRQLMSQLARAMAGHPRPMGIMGLGLAFVVLGLFKKVYLADSLAPHADILFLHTPADIFSAWLGSALFAFQIYFDFSGYSDIAVGSAYLLGMRIPFNFHTPYLSAGPREFWQRWHITLSTWIRDYLYIPLGGGRGGKPRVLAVLLVVMSLAGLWHGANTTFLVWGVAWGLYIAVCRLLAPWSTAPRFLRWLPHMAVVLLLWVFFRSPDLTFALAYLKVMLGLDPAARALPETSGLWAALGVAVLFALHGLEATLYRLGTLRLLKRLDGPLLWGLLAGLSLLLVTLPTQSANPFIYFRF